jgi:hypothetical protein
MDTRTDTPGLLARLLVPRALFLGAVGAFAACCLAGYLAGAKNLYMPFVRFHRYLNPESAYFPTASQVRAMGKGYFKKDKITVIVGGNSILFGSNQWAANVWSRHLQDTLGKRFQVLNLAVPAAYTNEFGAWGAEIISRDYPKLIFITDFGSSTLPSTLDGARYRYFFWDAYYKGLLPHDPARQQAVESLIAQRGRKDYVPAEQENEHDNTADGFAELLRRSWLESCLRFQDFWTSVAYKRFSTVWTWPVEGKFTIARQYLDDPEKPRSTFDRRYPPDFNQVHMDIIRKTLAGITPELLPSLVQSAFTADLAGRTLFLAVRDSPYYVKQLTPEEQGRYRGLFPHMVTALTGAGYHALDIGTDYSAWDYSDRCHLSEEGGEKLAATVAPCIRQMARQLGYLAREEE